MRPSWDEYFLGICQAVSERATCNRAHVGCVVVDEDNTILMTGYNGAPAGQPHCPEDELLGPSDHCLNSLHAENNVVVQAAKVGVSLKGATWYTYPLPPCENCMRRYILPLQPRRIVVGG